MIVNYLLGTIFLRQIYPIAQNHTFTTMPKHNIYQYSNIIIMSSDTTATTASSGVLRDRRLPNYPDSPPRHLWEAPLWISLKSFASALGEFPDIAKRRSARQLFQSLLFLIPCPKWSSRRVGSLWHKLRDETLDDKISSNRECYDWVLEMQQQQQQQQQEQQSTVAATTDSEFANHCGKLPNYPGSPPRRLWGPALWILMKVVASSLGTTPTYQQQTAARHFFTALCLLMPCHQCRIHYERLVKHTEPLTHLCFRNNKVCYDWVLRIENHVRKATMTESESKHLPKREATISWASISATTTSANGGGGGGGSFVHADKQ